VPKADKIRFVFSAGMQAEYKPFSLFDDMTAAQPDFALLLGDTIYNFDLPVDYRLLNKST
jgi:phosphodiesterase/alkaline phosphatase D-like protein